MRQRPSGDEEQSRHLSVGLEELGCIPLCIPLTAGWVYGPVAWSPAAAAASADQMPTCPCMARVCTCLVARSVLQVRELESAPAPHTLQAPFGANCAVTQAKIPVMKHDQPVYTVSDTCWPLLGRFTACCSELRPCSTRDVDSGTLIMPLARQGTASLLNGAAMQANQVWAAHKKQNVPELVQEVVPGFVCEGKVLGTAHVNELHGAAIHRHHDIRCMYILVHKSNLGAVHESQCCCYMPAGHHNHLDWDGHTPA